MDHMLESSEHQLVIANKDQKPSNTRISVIGSSESADKVRQLLNTTDLTKYNSILEDLGNITNEYMDEFLLYLPEIIESRHFIPLIIADDKYYSPLKAAMMHNQWISGIVDRDFRRYASAGYKDYNTYVGIQKHFGSYEDYGLSSDSIIRLSDIRTDSLSSEVALRKIDTAFIHLDALRYSDNIGHKGSWTAGMTIEEMCQVAKYIGASINIKGIVVGGFDENTDLHSCAAKNICTIIWYLCEGFQIRQKEIESLQSADNHNTYTVVPDDLDCELVFHENTQSGRWWLELPYQDDNDQKVLMPCTSSDYQEACINNISDKIMKIFSQV